MTFGPAHLAHSSHDHTTLARWAVGVAGVTAVVLVVAYGILGLAWVIDGEEAVSDTWVGYLAGYALVGGLATSFGAFVTALVSRFRHDGDRWLWLPLALFPTLATLTVLAELFWLE